MATKKKAAPSWNPYYVPPLSKIQAEAKAAAQAQINAAVGAIPTDATVSGQFAARGRDLAGLDTSYVTFLKNQAAARPTSASPGPVITPAGVGGGAGTASAAEAQNAAAASKALGIGFQNQNTALQNAAQGMVTLNQASNRKNMYDAIQQLQTQRAAERAKYGLTYQTELDKRKQQAFQAYQAYLTNQLNAASLGATASFNQGKLNISQQNADTAAQRAAQTGATSSTAAAAKKAASLTKARGTVSSWFDKAILPVKTKSRVQRWDIGITQPSGSGPKTSHITYFQAPLGWTAAQVKAKIQSQYPGKTLSITPFSTPIIETSAQPNTEHIYNTGIAKLRGAGYSATSAKRIMDSWFHANQIETPTEWAIRAGNTGRPGGDR